MFYEHLMGFHMKGEKHGFNHLISNNKIQKQYFRNSKMNFDILNFQAPIYTPKNFDDL